jgi:uncharacterized pyridoxal phosphate-containing UPF0001 family protein
MADALLILEELREELKRTEDNIDKLSIGISHGIRIAIRTVEKYMTTEERVAMSKRERADSE